MGVKNVEALTLARKICMFNSEVIFFVKNSLMMMTQIIQNDLKANHEKFTILIKSNFPKARYDLLLANWNNNENHDLLKLDVELVYDMLLEDVESESSN